MSIATLLAEEYKVDLEVFEGPLDLLLYLIRREEVDIYDIPIERITAQYLSYIEMMRMLDLDIAGEFLVMAATLMMIKSRMLLPVESRVAEDETDESWVDPRMDLVRQLIEYKKFKDVAGQLVARELLRAEAFGRGGLAVAEETRDAGHALGDLGLFDLLTAFQEALARVPDEPFGLLEPIRWSVPDKMEQILALTGAGESVSFFSLFTGASHRAEVIVTFLALLELLRLRQISFQQQGAFEEIVILPAAACASEPLPADGGGEHVGF